MELIVQLDDDAVASLERSSSTLGDAPAVVAELDALGIRLEPLFPGIDDSLLAGQFRAEISDDVTDEQLDGLRRAPGVLAAYVKPPGAPPSG